jgi:hypothetical protein
VSVQPSSSPPSTVRSACHVKLFTIGCRGSLKGEHISKTNIASAGSWVHQYQPETKRASMQWKHSASPAKKMFKATSSSRKVMLTVFWDHEGILLTAFQPQGQTVNADSYCKILRKLCKTIQRKRPGLLTQGVLLLHDNARPYTANKTNETQRNFKWEVLEHPPYGPDLAPSPTPVPISILQCHDYLHLNLL